MTDILDLIIEEERLKKQEEQFESSLEFLYIEAYKPENTTYTNNEISDDKEPSRVIEINIY
jgi:hypothetical protein